MYKNKCHLQQEIYSCLSCSFCLTYRTIILNQISFPDSLFSAVKNFTEIATKFSETLQGLNKNKYVLLTFI